MNQSIRGKLSSQIDAGVKLAIAIRLIPRYRVTQRFGRTAIAIEKHRRLGESISIWHSGESCDINRRQNFTDYSATS